MAANFDLTGRVALVTGASYSIGLAIAKGFAGAGATIVFNDIKEELVQRGLASYKEAGIEAHGYVCDVTDEAQVQAMVKKIEEEVGVIDILVNNAGIIKRIPMPVSYTHLDVYKRQPPAHALAGTESRHLCAGVYDHAARLMAEHEGKGNVRMSKVEPRVGAVADARALQTHEDLSLAAPGQRNVLVAQLPGRAQHEGFHRAVHMCLTFRRDAGRPRL